MLLLLAGCQSVRYFPTNDRPEYPYSVHRAKESTELAMKRCEYLGTMHTSGDADDVTYDMSREAAVHGATHFVLVNFREPEADGKAYHCPAD